MAEKKRDFEQNVYFDRLKHREDLSTFREDFTVTHSVYLPWQLSLRHSLTRFLYGERTQFKNGKKFYFDR